MNILRLVAADKEKKNRSPNPEFQKLEAAAVTCKERREATVLKFDKNELRSKLSPVEYFVTQERGTERSDSGFCQYRPLTLWTPNYFCQTPVGARLIFSMLLLGAELIFANLPLRAGFILESGKRCNPSRDLMPVTK